MIRHLRFSGLVLPVLLTAGTASGWASTPARSLGTGVALPAQGAAIRENPASSVGHETTLQLGAHYAAVAGGPISTVDGVWSGNGSTWAFGGGMEYSLATKNPEVHVGAGWSALGRHAFGASFSTRKTSSQQRSSAGLFSHSRWSASLVSGLKISGIGEGKEAMELAAGAGFLNLPWAWSRIEADAAYVFSSSSIALRPAFAAALPWNLVSAITFDVPLDRIGAFASYLALGYEAPTWNIQLRAGTNLSGELAGAFQF